MPSIPGEATTLAVIGDLQTTLPWERLFREDNGHDAARLVCQLGGESPKATVLLGDLVNWGSSDSSWEYLDDLRLRVGGVFLPVRGNHDYWGFRRAARVAWNRRFPWFDHEPWYWVRWNRVGLVFVDSNLDHLPPSARAREAYWYEQTLNSLQQSRDIEGIVVFVHHPPYTANPNANAQADLVRLRYAFVEPFCRYPKGLAMISGHAHGYERYAEPCGERTVQFVVSGGGGGPRPGLVCPRYEDECLAAGRCEPSFRPLNYLLVDQGVEGIDVTARPLSADGKLEVLDFVHIPWATAGNVR
jgi:hypothetical protein